MGIVIIVFITVRSCTWGDEKMNELARKKILIIGGQNVGKESLCRAYYPGCSEYFGKEYTPCIPETIEMTIDGSTIELELWLVTFDVYYTNLRQLCYPNTGPGSVVLDSFKTYFRFIFGLRSIKF